jgi:hypothetical protein
MGLGELNDYRERLLDFLDCEEGLGLTPRQRMRIWQEIGRVDEWMNKWTRKFQY